MRRTTIYVCAILAAASIFASACSDQLYLENAATPLALGMDLDKNDKFHFYGTVPVFSKNIKKKSQEIAGTAESLRQSRSFQDAQTAGTIQGRNYQVILLGRRLLQQEDWFAMLDVLFRDARNTITDRMIAVDGQVKDVIYLNPPDQPLMPILLRGMVDTKTKRSETYSTTAQELHRQFFDKGVTPYIAEIKITNKQVQLKGSALLNAKGKYAMSLNAQETVLLSILQKQADPGFSMSYRIPGKPLKGPFETDMLSFTGGKLKTKIKSGYENGRFTFDIHIKTKIGLSEHLFPVNVAQDAKKLEKQASALMEKQIEGLIQKMQKHRLDPIGLGVYARAKQYKQYIKVEEDWPEAFSHAVVNIKVELSIAAMGPVK
ncbi:Ger(x)C family spore germination protein [Paenibacillus luteus]|uniref:Ger(x)C family spore germination protein n=1 Tax=Paenibacillus luteus TaxID=2545753 RepID=UPI0011440379|nr:Ger(x)C family spore germination protein [Paenibacillus luteus]